MDRILPPEDDKHRLLRREANCIGAGVVKGLGNTREETAVALGNTLRCRRTPPTSTPQEPDFVLRRVSSSGEQALGYDGRNKGTQGHGREDDYGHIGSAQISFHSARARPTLRPQAQVSSDVDVRVPKPVFSSGRRTGCRIEEGLKETAVMEETATRMPDPVP
ncbi:uncharacterized protein ARMOST_15906 [Armillaria ostoyae]|uniref:Uncharacterized protein n=1 Tax=Armillaria ostoyae TaxID=47428 RepID=A0A284RUN1_ARMOS|nr:uncharacterized protein ARMOST_15906 [Armillaria ostoyae]